MTKEQWEEHFKDYYAILEIEKNADYKTIKKKYRKLATKYHPDLNPNDKEAEEKFKLINEAYAILSNNEKRAKYDAAYEKMKNESNANTNQGSNVNKESNNTKKETEREYTAQEKRYAKKLALKEIIKEELQKVDIIIDAINDLFLSGLSSEIDKREYYNAVKELVSTGFQFISSLDTLSKEAFKYDLLSEEEVILDTMENLKEQLNSIPITPGEVQRKDIENKYKESLNELIEENSIKAKECVDKLRSVLVYVYTGEITKLDYSQVFSNVMYESKNVLSILDKSIKKISEFGLVVNKKSIDALADLDSVIDLMPRDYETAYEMGSNEKIKFEIKEIILDYEAFDCKIQRMKRILDKHPNSQFYYVVCMSCLNLIEEKLEIIKNFNSSLSTKTCNTIPENVRTKKIKELSDTGVKLFKKANKLHKNANKIYEELDLKQILVNNNGKNVLKSIYYLVEDGKGVWKKSEALEMFIETKKLLKKYGYLNKTDDELNSLIARLKNIEKSAADLFEMFRVMAENEKIKQEEKSKQGQNSSVNNNQNNVGMKSEILQRLDIIRKELDKNFFKNMFGYFF